ncbi:hypothetical protein E2C01_066475 [Portunus trituberculatus]|uniref:Uncharacterized protein n=1 Tax=Portunus trituberculatus TaxID=210409 RepID=A0A5B7HI93_PORTR|nr:hypothetical protein [Portunus trituberculatus]
MENSRAAPRQKKRGRNLYMPNVLLPGQESSALCTRRLLPTNAITASGRGEVRKGVYFEEEEEEEGERRGRGGRGIHRKKTKNKKLKQEKEEEEENKD